MRPRPPRPRWMPRRATRRRRPRRRRPRRRRRPDPPAGASAAATPHRPMTTLDELLHRPGPGPHRVTLTLGGTGCRDARRPPARSRRPALRRPEPVPGQRHRRALSPGQPGPPLLGPARAEPGSSRPTPRSRRPTMRSSPPATGSPTSSSSRPRATRRPTPSSPRASARCGRRSRCGGRGRSCSSTSGPPGSQPAVRSTFAGVSSRASRWAADRASSCPGRTRRRRRSTRASTSSGTWPARCAADPRSLGRQLAVDEVDVDPLAPADVLRAVEDHQPDDDDPDHERRDPPGVLRVAATRAAGTAARRRPGRA